MASSFHVQQRHCRLLASLCRLVLGPAGWLLPFAYSKRRCRLLASLCRLVRACRVASSFHVQRCFTTDVRACRLLASLCGGVPRTRPCQGKGEGLFIHREASSFRVTTRAPIRSCFGLLASLCRLLRFSSGPFQGPSMPYYASLLPAKKLATGWLLPSASARPALPGLCFGLLASLCGLLRFGSRLSTARQRLLRFANHREPSLDGPQGGFFFASAQPTRLGSFVVVVLFFVLFRLPPPPGREQAYLR